MTESKEFDADSSWVARSTVSGALRRASSRYPDRDALVFPRLGVRWTWSELDRRVDRFASALLELGVQSGEHVGIWSMNCPEWVTTQFAAARIGATLVNINPAYRVHELEAALKLADVSTLIVGPPYKSSNYIQIIESICPEVLSAAPGEWRSSRFPLLSRLISVEAAAGSGLLDFSRLAEHAIDPSLADRESSIVPGDPHNIQFTSGTTGLPKGATLTHKNVLYNAYYVGARLRYTEADRVCVPVPFYHCFGCVLGTLVCVVYGSAIVVPSTSFDPGAVLAAIESERCTSLYGVPTMFIAELDHPDFSKYDLSTLRTGIMSGAPCPLPVLRRVVDRMHAKEICVGYGQTESSPIITLSDVDDPLEARVGTVGRALPGLDVEILDRSTGERVPDGVAGELCVRGHVVMAGYYKAPEATERAIDSNGFLHTGDLAIRRDDGRYRIVGRCKEMIIRGGENIHPPEIEEFLHHHPKIAEVAIVGLPDRLYGEVVSAWIVPKAGESIAPEEIVSYCRDRIAHFKIPKYISIVDQLPRTVTGKIQKHVLRRVGVSEHGLEEAESTPTA
jgi:fatty-acyl-CoA synthase